MSSAWNIAFDLDVNDLLRLGQVNREYYNLINNPYFQDKYSTQHGLLNGYLKISNNDGPSEEGLWVLGRKEGLHIIKDHDGTILSEGVYLHDHLHGFYREFFKNDIAYEGQYLNGHKMGIHREWYESGDLKSETNYIDDNNYIVKLWDHQGNLISKRTIMGSPSKLVRSYLE